MRTDAWRYVEWTKTGEQSVHELYDMARDPQNDINLAARSEYGTVCESLHQRLRKQFPVQQFHPPPAGKK
jgi:hypothetical protein